MESVENIIRRQPTLPPKVAAWLQDQYYTDPDYIKRFTCPEEPSHEMALIMDEYNVQNDDIFGGY